MLKCCLASKELVSTLVELVRSVGATRRTAHAEHRETSRWAGAVSGGCSRNAALTASVCCSNTSLPARSTNTSEWGQLFVAVFCFVFVKNHDKVFISQRISVRRFTFKGLMINVEEKTLKLLRTSIGVSCCWTL